MDKQGIKKMAVLVGCNYPNTPHELHGCINDVLAMQKTLISRFGFDRSNVELLTDAPGSSSVKPTGENIKKALRGMIDKAEAGDVLFFHYSGHGTLIPSVKPGHPFRRDEAIVPCDFNLITDVDFRQLVNALPKDASFTILSDSCHSGGLIDKEKEQIGPSTLTHEFDKTLVPNKPKAIPIETILQHLSSLTNIDSSDIAKHLQQSFGPNASLKFFSQSQQSPLTLQVDAGILLSGCQSNETSADMSPNGISGKAYGAFSNAIQMVLKENSGPLSNKEIVKKAREILQAQRVEQHPCLYCSDENASKPFLGQQQQEEQIKPASSVT